MEKIYTDPEDSMMPGQHTKAYENSFAKGLRFDQRRGSTIDKWQYMTHPQKWSYIKKEAWS